MHDLRRCVAAVESVFTPDHINRVAGQYLPASALEHRAMPKLDLLMPAGIFIALQANLAHSIGHRRRLYRESFFIYRGDKHSNN